VALSDNARAALIGLGGAAVAFVVMRGGGGAAAEPIDAAPKASFLVGTVDVEELRRSPLYEALAGKDGGPTARALGMGKLADACGFDPLARLQRVAVAVPEEGERGDFGVAARVEVKKSELEACTRALTAERGDRAETREVGGFVVLDTGKDSRIAYGQGGLLLVARSAWLEAMIATAERKAPGVKDAPEHAALRASLTSREGFGKPTLLATAILPRALRDRLRRDMEGEADPSNAASNAAMLGVLGVSAAGVAVNAGAPGKLTEATVELACDSPEQCEAVSKLILKKRLDWSKDLSLRLVGLGAVVDSLDVKHEGKRVRVAASASADGLAASVKRVLEMRAREGAPTERRLGPERKALPLPVPSALRDPDETVPSAKDGGAR
jgi:hypothetical protein